MSGTMRYERQQDGHFALAARKDAPRIVQIKSSKFGDQPLIAQEASDNHIMVLDKLLVQVGRAENGIREEGDSKIYSNTSQTRL